MAERDFTKQYNRLRQHVAVRTGNVQGIVSNAPSTSVTTATSSSGSVHVASLPAVNRPRNVDVTKQRDKTADQLAALSKYSSRISNIDLPYQLGVGVNRKGPSATANMKDKSDRATTEQVLDPRTRVILYKMIGRGLIQEVNGCVSTGKEANVYHAVSPTGEHLALKIYKTSILVFKDRDKYVSGEYRFRRGYSRHNPRKMVRVWAEKEMRNLKRLAAAGLPCPRAVEVRENVLVMSFLGDEEGWASPRLKDASIPSADYPALYSEIVLAVRTLFHKCKLVHADLSEYNIIYHKSHLYIIDVSQSVEHDHPHAFDFLRNDLKNVEEYFGRAGVKTLGLRRSFDFVTRDQLADGAETEEVEVLHQWLAEEVKEDEINENDEEVFRKSYIPRRLNELYDPERDVALVKEGEGDKLIYADSIGLVDPAKEKRVEGKGEKGQVRFEDQSGSEDEDEEEEGEEESGDSEEKPSEDRRPRGHRHEDREAKKVAPSMSRPMHADHML
ncbi:RIO1-domain-containing protein [Punctularia strigosozonata HHB-11173 SS5]|uniref:RIO1-domain-containing protein n=1 Tax=Punctularia strigosozonata (strain HHB-11173) TaxID=741275 RepID=UPI0004417931|nr:RIO1-domain-containing protein [Punctularia strigosozonata HHB-11173 SS5]EIN12972.1 RIO1-domain-containing protein [Punctularia strigosozonata HHB-11173 SS5]